MGGVAGYAGLPPTTAEAALLGKADGATSLGADVAGFQAGLSGVDAILQSFWRDFIFE